MHLSCHFERQDGLHRVNAAAGIAARKGEAVVLNVVVVGDQMEVDILGIFCVVGIVNNGVLIELLNGLPAGLPGQFL